MSAANIILGDGVFAINGVDIALTRGGGSFSVEREYRQIEADGDYGPVKGRIRKVKSVSKMKLSALTILEEDLTKMYPSTNMTDGVWTGTGDIDDADYQTTVTWTGRTKGGKGVVITLQNAINLEAIEWGLVDKNEIIPEITYTAAYLETDRGTEPWKVTFSAAPVE